MSDQIQGFAMTIPKDGSPDNVFFVDCALGLSDVTQIDIVFPPGCSGLVGARIEFAGNVVYPTGSEQWFVLDDDRIQIPVSSQGNSGQWRLAGYNTDVYQHNIYAYFYFNYVEYGNSPSSGLVSL